jgi:hypothetical protein
MIMLNYAKERDGGMENRAGWWRIDLVDFGASQVNDVSRCFPNALQFFLRFNFPQQVVRMFCDALGPHFVRSGQMLQFSLF